MDISFEGVGQWCATFSCADGVEEGQLVKISSSGEVSPCSDGDAFAGYASILGRKGTICGVALGGMITVPYTGSTPTLGWCHLSADGNGGVKVDSTGHAYLVAALDENNAAVTFVL